MPLRVQTTGWPETPHRGYTERLRRTSNDLLSALQMHPITVRSRSRLIGQTLVALVLTSAIVLGQPTVEVRVAADSSNVRGTTWIVEATPDPELFVTRNDGSVGGSLAIEIPISLSGGRIIDASLVEPGPWVFENRGNNPFSDSITRGIWFDEQRTNLFASLGSELLESEAPTEVFSFTTSSGTTQRCPLG